MKKTAMSAAALLTGIVLSAQAFVPGIASSNTASSDSLAAKIEFLKKQRRPLSAIRSAKTAATVPLATIDGSKKIYGGLVYADSWSSSYAPYGIYSTTVAPPLTVTSEYISEVCKVNGGGFYADGKYYFIDYTIDTFDGEEYVYTYLYVNEAYPFKYLSNVSLGMDHIAKDLTFDPIEQRVYGIFSIGNLEAKYLIGAMSMTDYKIEEYCELPDTHVAIAADGRGTVYTIGGDGVFYRLDKAAREMVAVGHTGVSDVDTHYAQSATIDMETGVFYWAALHGDGSSALYTVDTTTGKATKVADFPDNEEFAGIFIPDIVDDAAPQAAEELYPEFEDGSLSGIIAFDAPKLRQDGNILSGDLTFHLKVNGERAYSGAVKAGKRNYEIEVTVPENGFYTFSLTLENQAGESFPTSLRTYIGNDRPVACPEATAVNEDRSGVIDLKWSKPRKGQNGGYVDIEALTFDVTRFPDNMKVAEAVSDTVFRDNVTRADLKCYYYTITPAANGMIGEAVKTNKVVVGHVAEVPYVETFDTDVDFSTFTVVDVDNDGVDGWGAWSQSNYLDGVATAMAASGDNTGNAKDDWLFTPPVHLYPDRTYVLTYRAMSQGNRIVPGFREYMEVKMGAEANIGAMTETLLDNREIDNEYRSYNNYEHVLHVDTEGNYHIGFHATTPGAELMWNLVLDDVSIVEGAFVNGPARVDDLSVVAGENGALTVELNFKAPMRTISGDAISILEKIEILRGGTLIRTFEKPEPGASLSYVDQSAVQGDNEYVIVAYDDENRGLEAKVTVYAGLDIPGKVRDLELHDKDGVVTLSWNAPDETGPEGHYVDPEGLTYTVIRYFNEYNYVEVAKDITDRFFEDADVDASDQTQVAYRVTATNKVGTGEAAGSDAIFVGGENALLPVSESFPGRNSTCKALRYISGDNGAAWGAIDKIEDPDIFPVDDDGGMAIFGLTGTVQPGQEGLSAMLYTHRVSLASTVNASLSFYVYHVAGSRNKLDIMVNPVTYGWESVATVPVSDGDKRGWSHVVVPLGMYKDYAYVQIGFRGTGWDDELVIVDDIVIDDMLDHNLELTSFNVDAVVVPAEETIASAVVTNRGLNEATDYVVQLFVDGKVYAEKAGVALKPGNSATFKFSYMPTLASARECILSAAVSYSIDMKEIDDRSDDCMVYTDLPRMAYVTDLRGEESQAGVSLVWSSPDESTAMPEPMTDNMESYASFIIDNIGAWSLYDGDGQATWGISDGTGSGSILKYDNAGKPMAWQVFNPVKAGLSVNYDPDGTEGYELPDWRPYSGNQMLISYAPMTGASDDWLISEELTGDMQIVSFMGRSVLTQYSERCEVLASSTDKSVESFESVGVRTFGKEWTRMAAVLPEGSRYFAIRCISPQQFAMLVDDVTYTPSGAAVAASTVVGYNVYRDGEKLTEFPIVDHSYVDVTAGDTYHSYRVSAVYDIGESRLSNEFAIGQSAVGSVVAGCAPAIMVEGRDVVVLGAEGSPVVVCLVDGRIVARTASASTSERISLLPGIYVVKAGIVSAKIVIR